MSSSISFKKINNILSKCDISILYKPLSDELDYINIPLAKNIFKKKMVLSNTKTNDPYIWADHCQNYCKGKTVCILIPGRQFDIYGTRHGRGGGWYDRFLANIPKEWARIGVAHSSKLSNLPLKRESWDEPVDWIIVNDNSTWQIYETKARN